MKLKIKMGLKIAILVFATLTLMLEAVLQYFKHKNIDEFKLFNQTNLLQSAKLIASNIDGDDHKLAIMPNDSTNHYYKKIQSYLEKSKNSINFREEIFTVFLHNDTASCFGVKTNTDNISGQACEFRDESLYPIFKKAFKENKALYSDIYSDRGGFWLSAFAPVLDHGNKAVAVLELDLSINEYRARLAEFTSWAYYYRVIGVILSLVIGFSFGYFFGKPLSDISKGMTEVAEKSFLRKIDTPFLNKIFPDEILILVNNFNTMSEKLETTLNELQIAYEKVNDLNKSKTIFLNLIAHELRTPLTGVGGFIDLLKNHSNCGAEEADIINSLQLSYERLRKFSLSAEKYISALNYEPIPNYNYKSNLNEIILEIVKNVKLANADKIMGIRLSINENQEILCGIDEQILYDILEIIIDNAVKFSNSNPRIDISAKLIDNNVMVIIRDYGVGIEPVNLEKIFEPFFVNNIMQHSEGSGINLPICKTYLKKFGGNIQAFSEGIGKGAIFSLVIPLYSC